MKKLTSALLAAVITSGAAFANQPSVTGFYLGANVGVANTNAKSTFDPKDANPRKNDTGNSAAVFGVFGGYGMLMGNVYVGGELALGLDTSKVSLAKDNTTKAEIKRGFTYSFAPRLGFMVSSNILAYVRLGLEGGKWKYTNNVTGTPTFTKSFNQVEFVPGVGFDMFVTPKLFVRAEYKYNVGHKLKVIVNNVEKFNTKVTQHVFGLGLGYKF